MLEIGKQKIYQNVNSIIVKSIWLLEMRSLYPVTADNTVDVVTVAFGVRNFGDLQQRAF